MGYESRLYVVEKSTLKCEVDGEEMRWGEVVAMFDLCVVYGWSGEMGRFKDTDAYIYGSDGNTRITRDGYGERLKEVPLGDAVKILRREAEKDPYRRFKPCIALLEAFNEDEWRELVVLHYGH